MRGGDVSRLAERRAARRVYRRARTGAEVQQRADSGARARRRQEDEYTCCKQPGAVL